MKQIFFILLTLFFTKPVSAPGGESESAKEGQKIVKKTVEFEECSTVQPLTEALSVLETKIESMSNQSIAFIAIIVTIVVGILGIVVGIVGIIGTLIWAIWMDDQRFRRFEQIQAAQFQQNQNPPPAQPRAPEGEQIQQAIIPPHEILDEHQGIPVPEHLIPPGPQQVGIFRRILANCNII